MNYRRSVSLGGRPTLAVEAVGSFDASYVPSADDMDRLDVRFRIPPGVFELNPSYREKPWGFVVFKLRDASVSAHPMGFCFRRACSGLHVPTVHAHDGQDAGVPKRMEPFDHQIFAQCDSEPIPVFGARFVRSYRAVGSRSGGGSGSGRPHLSDVCTPGMPIFRLVLNGLFPNQDIQVVPQHS